MVKIYNLVQSVGFAHLWRPRSNIFENKFSRVVCLATCRMACLTYEGAFVVSIQHQTKSKTPLARGYTFGAECRIRTYEGISREIYSLLCLTASLTLLVKA